MAEMRKVSIDCVCGNKLTATVFKGGAYKATKYVSDKLTIKGTRRLYKGRVDKRSRIAEVLFTIGAPNYEEREFIKRAKKQGVVFPVEGVVARFPK